MITLAVAWIIVGTGSPVGVVMVPITAFFDFLCVAVIAEAWQERGQK